MATNLTAAFLLTQAVIPVMREQGWGRIINVSSVAAQNGGIIGPHYAASKAGLLGLTRSYARQLASEGVTVNAIAPGLIATDKVTESSVTPEAVPVGRFGTPTEVAQVVRSVVCNGFLTGQVINIDGGIYFG
jgi:3-oxoacyl-[acyl-carrier protein] reductase